MDFHEKLQALRKKRGITQEELAGSIFVSRTAVSKWESGRGYPNIDSLKALAKFFSVTVDELLSGDEVLTIAEEDRREKEAQLRKLVFSVLDCSALMFLFLPLFGQQTDGGVHAVSLLQLTEVSPYMKALYFAAVCGLALTGVFSLIFKNRSANASIGGRDKLSLAFNAAGALLFIVSQQPYAAVFLFVYLAVKALMLINRA